MGRWLPEADGITVSGGEPLDQAPALRELLTEVRPRLTGDVLLFTGYSTATALAHPLVTDGLIDAIVPEPFDRNAPQTRALRGSDNQPLLPITDLGRKLYAGIVDAPPDRRLDVMFDADSVWFAGIPARGDFVRLEASLGAKGHRVTTSAEGHPPMASE
jgi:anaerobic ribonucleoside-triphosphate reductase activating protein